MKIIDVLELMREPSPRPSESHDTETEIRRHGWRAREQIDKSRYLPEIEFPRLQVGCWIEFELPLGVF